MSNGGGTNRTLALDRGGTPETAVDEHLDDDVVRCPGEDLVEIVVEDERVAVPVHVVRADDLVERVRELVTVAIAHLRPVPRVVEDEDVPGLRGSDRELDAVHDVRLRRTAIHEHVDVLVRDAEGLDGVSNEGDVVDAAGERRDVRVLVDVDADQDTSDPHAAPSLEGPGT